MNDSFNQKTVSAIEAYKIVFDYYSFDKAIELSFILLNAKIENIISIRYSDWIYKQHARDIIRSINDFPKFADDSFFRLNPGDILSYELQHSKINMLDFIHLNKERGLFISPFNNGIFID